MIKFTGDLRLDFEKATTEILKLKDRILGYQEQIASLRETVKRLEKSKDSDKKQYSESLSEKDAIIKELQNRLAHAEALLNHDGSNTGTPTSQTPINKNKVIPNSRRNTGKPKGGQIGHPKSSLKEPAESEITDTIGHPLQNDECCPKCSLIDCTPTGESEVKYEYDVRIKVVKVKHEFFYYECKNCGTIFRSQIPPNLKEKVQYGSGLQAFALSLTNTVNAAMNKASMFLAGITGGGLTPCEGYIAKLQARAAKGLRQLNLLTSDTKTMHDHNTVNYNDKYSFENIECNQHLQRDCQKNTDDTCHQWSDDLKEHIGTTIKDRNDAISRGEESFNEAYVKEFHRKLDEYIENGRKENEADPGNYGASFEQTLLNRITKYRRNYFLWVEDFSLPTTNNLSERGLRGVKSHMKISGQFESEAAADNHALIRTYIETCRRNGINEIDALQRLCEGNPYTVADIFPASSP